MVRYRQQIASTESYSGSRDYQHTDRTREGNKRTKIKMTYQVVYKSGDEIIDNRGMDESQLSVALQYGKEQSNRTQKHIAVSIIQQSVMSYNILPDN